MSFLPHGSDPSTAAFTCNTCGIRFSAAEFQRKHMKTDWHKYNLKRRVAELPSIPSEVFAEKVLQLQHQREQILENEDELGFYVHHRKRPGRGERQLTKKEKRQMAKRLMQKVKVVAGSKNNEHYEDEIEGNEEDNDHFEETGQDHDQDVDSNRLEKVLLTRCQSPTTSVVSEFSEFSLGDSMHLSEGESNFETGSEVHYSDTTHSDWDSLRSSEDDDGDDESEDDSDDEIVDVLPNYFCFYCGENNHELERNIRHMSSHHGLYIPERSYLVDLEGLLTYLNEVISIDHECLTCGYTGMDLESIRKHCRSKGHCRIPYENPQERDAISEFYDFINEEVIIPRLKKSKKAKTVSFAEPSIAAEDELSEEDYDGVDSLSSTVETTLILPSGSKVGHRSMIRYYRQNLPGPRQAPEATKTVALADRRFAPGITSVQISKQQREVNKLELKARNFHERRTKPARVNFQKHFRDEMLGPM